MKKNFSVNIQGRLFHMDEDAYALLENYFEELKKTFEQDINSQEIIDDFQKRISDALWDMSKHHDQPIINIQHVQKVLAGFGYYETGDAHHEQEKKDSRTVKRLFRNPDNRIFGGVCGGIASYFNIDLLVVRIIFGIFGLLLATGIVVYFILWIVIPVASSPIDRLNMKGEPVSIDRVREMISKEFKNVEASFRNMGKKHKNHRFFWDIEHQFKDLFRASVVFRSISGSLLVAFSLLAITGLVIFLVVSFDVQSLPGLQLNNFGQLGQIFYDSALLGILLKWSLFLMFLVPFAGVLIFGASLLTGLVFRTGVIRWISQYVGTISLLIVIFCAVLLYIQFLFLDKSETVYVFEPNYYQEIKLDIDESGEEFGSDTVSSSAWFFAVRNDSLLISGKPELRILPSASDSILVVVQKRSYGRNMLKAAENNRNVFFLPSARNDTLFLMKRWYSNSNALWRGQNVRIIIFVPPGKRLSFSDAFRKWYIPLFDKEEETQKYKMTEQGLEKI
jgi:phage shock protein C